jgi:hypothetical protein
MTGYNLSQFFKNYTSQIFIGSVLGLVFLSLLSVAMPALSSQGSYAQAWTQPSQQSQSIFAIANEAVVNNNGISFGCGFADPRECRGVRFYYHLATQTNQDIPTANLRYSSRSHNFEASLPRNLRCNNHYTINIYQTDYNSNNNIRLVHSQPFDASQYCNQVFRVAGQVDSVEYNQRNVVIKGRVISGTNRRARVSFYTKPFDNTSINRVGTATTDQNGNFGTSISYSDRLFETGRLYAYTAVEGWLWELNNSPISISRAEWDRQTTARQAQRIANNSTTNTTQSTSRQRVNAQTNNSTNGYNSPMQVLNTRYTSGMVKLRYTDREQNYITLRDDSDLARLLQTHARSHKTGFGSTTHMDILANQSILIKRGNDWYIDLRKLESRV